MAMFTSFLMLLVGLPEANSGENPKQHIQRQLIKGWIPAGAALEDSAQGVHGVFPAALSARGPEPCRGNTCE